MRVTTKFKKRGQDAVQEAVQEGSVGAAWSHSSGPTITFAVNVYGEDGDTQLPAARIYMSLEEARKLAARLLRTVMEYEARCAAEGL